MCQGVAKSGSPTPSDIAPSVEATKSKKRLIPEGVILFTICEVVFLTLVDIEKSL